MKKILHIVFKNTSCVDYIFPYFDSKLDLKRNNLEFLIWDVDAIRIADNLPKNFKNYTYKNIFHFVRFRKLFKLNKIKILKFKSLIDSSVFLKIYKIKSYIKKFDEIYFDCRSFDSLIFKKTIFYILNNLKKKIIYVPHAAHYRSSSEELTKSNIALPQRYDLILSNKLSNPWIKFDLSKKNCFYLNLPTNNKLWKKKIKFFENKDNKVVGFIFRPFIKKKNKTQLSKKDYYINSYEENLMMIEIAKYLFSKGYKIIFRLHPSSKIKDFENYYKNDLKFFKFLFSKGSIHDFLIDIDKVVSFHSTALIYAANYKKKIYLLKTDLEKKIYIKWPKLKKIYKSFCIEIKDKEDFKKKFIKREFNYKQSILKELW